MVERGEVITGSEVAPRTKKKEKVYAGSHTAIVFTEAS